MLKWGRLQLQHHSEPEGWKALVFKRSVVVVVSLSLAPFLFFEQLVVVS